MSEDPRLDPNIIKGVLDDEHFQLALEKQVHDRTDGYLKRLGGFALILLAVAGYGSWNLVDEARKKYEVSEAKLNKQIDDLNKDLTKVHEDARKLEEKSDEAQRTLLTVQQDAFSVTKDVDKVQHIKQAAQTASTAAADAIS